MSSKKKNKKKDNSSSEESSEEKKSKTPKKNSKKDKSPKKSSTKKEKKKKDKSSESEDQVSKEEPITIKEDAIDFQKFALELSKTIDNISNRLLLLEKSEVKIVENKPVNRKLSVGSTPIFLAKNKSKMIPKEDKNIKDVIPPSNVNIVIEEQQEKESQNSWMEEFSSNLKKGDGPACTNLLVNNLDSDVSNYKSSDKDSFAFINENSLTAFDIYLEIRGKNDMNLKHKQKTVGETAFFNMVEIATAKELLQTDIFTPGLLRLVIQQLGCLETAINVGACQKDKDIGIDTFHKLFIESQGIVSRAEVKGEIKKNGTVAKIKGNKQNKPNQSDDVRYRSPRNDNQRNQNRNQNGSGQNSFTQSGNARNNFSNTANNGNNS